jgi:hypothetical protein
MRAPLQVLPGSVSPGRCKHEALLWIKDFPAKFMLRQRTDNLRL